MDANQRSEVNNQTNNGANEKDTPGAQGNTRSGPMDHTYPNAASQQRSTRSSGVDENGTGMAHPGSMQGQQNGGSGPVQGITDSHQRQMEMHSGAWGQLEQPVGNRQRDDSVSVSEGTVNRQGKTQTGDTLNPQDPHHPQLQTGGVPPREGKVPGTDELDARGTEAGVPGVQHGDIYGNRQSADDNRADNRADTQDARNSKIQQNTDRQASQTGDNGRETGVQDIHQSNNASGGLPRSPGGTGPRTEGEGYQSGGSMHAEPNPVHQSNDAAGGYPRSPGGANKLAGDRKMDDDTGFSRG